MPREEEGPCFIFILISKKYTTPYLYLDFLLLFVFPSWQLFFSPKAKKVHTCNI